MGGMGIMHIDALAHDGLDLVWCLERVKSTLLRGVCFFEGTHYLPRRLPTQLIYMVNEREYLRLCVRLHWHDMREYFDQHVEGRERTKKINRSGSEKPNNRSKEGKKKRKIKK